jgi:hypothetical protein
MPGPSSEEARAIVGRFGDQQMTEILVLGASRSELLEALPWLSGSGGHEPAGVLGPEGRVVRFCEILAITEIAEEVERRS